MPEDRIRALTGILKGQPSLLDALMKSREAERRRDAEKAAQFCGSNILRKARK